MSLTEKEPILSVSVAAPHHAEHKKETVHAPLAKNNAQKVSTLGGFIAGGVAACMAVTFTNPIELIKTRMQLQGELAKTSKDSVMLYKNPIQAFGVIYRNEGIRGLQQGLVSGYYYQVGLNGCRLGLYEPSRYYLTKLVAPSTLAEDGHITSPSLPVNVVAGFISGAAGAVLASPLFLIKTRMQSFTNSHSGGAAVGEQTFYKNTWDGISKIYSSEGIRGLYRGVDAAILRTGAGSAAQLPTYYLTKSFLVKHNLAQENTFSLNFISSIMAGLGVAIVMNPWDVVLTRMYNQKGDLYTGPLDCFKKTIAAEGPMALYKGFWAQLFRIGPHTILTLLFMEQCLKGMVKIEQKLGYLK
jgi:solute carrier family 25 protein 34/35